MTNQKILRRSYQKKFDAFKTVLIKQPTQGWLKTIREILGMTTTQLAKKLGISQPRVVCLEKNEKNIKISTMERIADALNCDFIYAIVPREKIDNIIYNQTRKKALKILNKVNQNMVLENQLSNSNELLEDIINELLDSSTTKLWDEE